MIRSIVRFPYGGHVYRTRFNQIFKRKSFFKRKSYEVMGLKSYSSMGLQLAIVNPLSGEFWPLEKSNLQYYFFILNNNNNQHKILLTH